MNFLRITNSIKEVQDHLTSSGSENTEIETYLVAFLLVLIYSEFETRSKILIARRCAFTTDTHLKNFAQSIAKTGSEANQAELARKAGRITVDDLAATLEKFGADYRAAFLAQIKNTPAAIAWDLVVSNRHLIAHQTGTAVTFSDLVREYPISLGILDSFAAALQLTSAHLSDLT